MKKKINNYVIAWAILLVLFNIIVFVTPAEFAGYSKFGGAFWGSYVCIMVAFVGQLACALMAFRANSLTKLFYNLPLITVSYTGLILTLIVGGACMVIPDLPNWAGIIACAVVLAFTAIAVTKAQAASDIIESIDEKVKVQTDFMRTVTAQAKALGGYAKTDEAKAAVEKVYEALRYSEVRSIGAAIGVERNMQEQLDAFAAAVKNGEADKMNAAMDALLPMIAERNTICKSGK